MIKRICFLVVVFACAACAFFYGVPKRAYLEGGTDHFYFNGEQCRILTYPLNEYIAKHYSQWPFRPWVREWYYSPMYMYYGPEKGGGYTAFWSIHDSSLYLDSVLVKSYSRSIQAPEGFPEKSEEDPRIVSVSIPPQEIILNTSAEKRTFKQKSEPLFADFFSDTIGFTCGKENYEFIVKNGRTLSLPKHNLSNIDRYPRNNLHYGFYDPRWYKEEEYEKNLEMFRETASPFSAYYKVLDSLRQELDDVGNEPILEMFRKDSKFKRFEDFFNIKAIVGRSQSEYNFEYFAYVSLKGDTPFDELVLRLLEYENFLEDPIESVKLFLKTLIAVRKNPTFEKWLRYKKSLMNYTEVMLSYRDSLGLYRPVPRDTAWKNVGMRGEYVGSLQYVDHYYEFDLSDSGDVLVTTAWEPEGDNLPNIEDDRPYFKGFKRQAEMVQMDNHFYDYIIIRNDGTVEIGPKSGWW
ncbi:hypothetical protein [Fibrobacter sp.]|uniref:hypothetical protein n=1 Tax=Fibrobacter sp. TaxID=35828 RepID=UPI0025C067EE|nr:hypothetical protein [Fibrobacter sp.]MBR3074114.1 hypothetical protein [Fibrobacter sp.]